MSRPDWEVSAAFGQSPFAALSTLTWTDISADVLNDPAFGGGPISFRRGRQSELGTVEAGTLTLTLNNSDRKYDPTNTASIYFGSVRPMTRIRVRARWPVTVGAWTTLWTGYVTAWQPVYPSPLGATVQVRAADAFTAIARSQVSIVSLPPGELTGFAIRTALNVIGWAYLTDYNVPDAGLTRVADGSYPNLNTLQYMQTIVQTENGLLFVDGQGFPTFQDRHYRINHATITAVYGNNGTVNTVLSSGINASVTTLPLLSTAGFSSVGGIVTIDSEQITYTGKNSTQLTGGVRGYHGTTAASHLSSAAVSFVERPFADVAFSYDEALLYNDIQVTRAGGTLQEATTSIATALNGAINNSVTTITVDDTSLFPTSGTIQIDNEQITHTGKSATQFTTCTRGANGTSAASHSDNIGVFDPTTSTALYGPRVLTQTGLYMAGDDEALGLAQWLLVQYQSPNLRVTSIVVNGELNPTSLWSILLASEISDKIEVIVRPPGGGFIDQYARIEAIQHTISPESWLITYQLSLAGEDAYWVLGSATQSILGSTTRLAF